VSDLPATICFTDETALWLYELPETSPELSCPIVRKAWDLVHLAAMKPLIAQLKKDLMKRKMMSAAPMN
jgi:hypothetical protein